MNIALTQILSLVGKLDDAPGDETPRERFRRFLRDNVRNVAQVRDYVEECLRNSGDQYNRALQDLVNHLGSFLGFEVTFGRYHGMHGEIGFDGYWRSELGAHIVVEVKTTEVYAIKTSALVGYVDSLISDQVIPSWDHTLGLYVIGRPDPDLRQLENAIVAERRTHQLRIISVESLLSLAEMLTEYDMNHADVLAVLQPSGPRIDPVVDLMSRLVAEQQSARASAQPVVREPGIPPDTKPRSGTRDKALPDTEVAHWLTPVRSDATGSAEEVIDTLVGRERIYAFGDRTPGRRHIKPGDRICFYASGTGVVAHATVASVPKQQSHPRVRDPAKYPWVFAVDSARLYLERPVVLDADLRAKLDAFRSRDSFKSWAWFVQATRRITEHDFRLLTRQ